MAQRVFVGLKIRPLVDFGMNHGLIINHAVHVLNLAQSTILLVWRVQSHDQLLFSQARLGLALVLALLASLSLLVLGIKVVLNAREWHFG